MGLPYISDFLLRSHTSVSLHTNLYMGGSGNLPGRSGLGRGRANMSAMQTSELEATFVALSQLGGDV